MTHSAGNAVRALSPKLRVVLVAGAGRSGSTLLTLMLGSLPDAFAVGELRYLWERGIVEQRLCGCGQPVPECSVWSKILGRAFDHLSAADIEDAIDGVNWLGAASNLPKILRRGRWGRFPELGDLPTQLGRLYRATADVTGAQVIIDSSKPPTYGWFVGTLPDIELSVIHLVRDPRATAFSWQRPKAAIDRPSGGLMPNKPPWKSVLSWDLWNTATELLFRSRPERLLRLRYEDLVADPETARCSVLEFLGYPVDALDSLNGRSFTRGGVSHRRGKPFPARSRADDGQTRLRVAGRDDHGGAPRRHGIVSPVTAPLWVPGRAQAWQSAPREHRVVMSEHEGTARRRH